MTNFEWVCWVGLPYKNKSAEPMKENGDQGNLEAWTGDHAKAGYRALSVFKGTTEFGITYLACTQL